MKKPKVVFWDLETMHNPRLICRHIPSIAAWPGRTWRAELGVILSFGYQIEGGAVKSINLWDFPEWEFNRFDDSLMCEAIMEILSDADEIVTHNGIKYDFKYLNTRLAKNGMAPLPKRKHVDTKQILSSHMTLYSNSLDAAAQFYELDQKKMVVHNKWSLWERFMFKEDTAKDRKLMSDYCKQDISTLRELYYATRPFHGTKGIDRNLWLEAGEPVCNTCGSDQLIGHGTIPRKKYVAQRWLCKSCGSTRETRIPKVKTLKLKAIK